MIEVKEPEEKEPEYDYPLARKSKDKGHVVLFHNLTVGTVVQNSSGHYKAGYFDGWTAHTNRSVWLPVEVLIKD